MQVFGHRLPEAGKPLPLGYYLNGGNKQTAAIESTAKIDGMTLFEGAEKGSLAIVSTFLLGGVDPNVNEREDSRATPLHYACKGGEMMIVRFLLDNGATVDSTTSSGETPLMWALKANHPDIVMTLLDKGANPHHADDSGRSAAYFGACSPTSVHCIYKRGVNLAEAALNDQQTLLHVAVQTMESTGRHHSAWSAVLYLTETAGIDANLQDASGRTALHYACANGDINAVKALVLKGARHTVADNTGALPVDVPRCPTNIKSFISAFVAEKSTGKQQKMAQPDYSNWAALDLLQLKHFLVAFFVPNTIVAGGAYLPTWIGLWTLAVFAIGFVTVAQFSMKQKRRSMATAGWFSGALFYGSAILFTKVFGPYKQCHENHFAVYLWWATTVPMFYCFIRAVLADPGVVPSTSEQRAEIYEAITAGGEAEIKRQGFDMVSMVRKPLRAKHCTKTGQCVCRFDHFCVWTGNAIGGGNHRHFVYYCLFQMIAQAVVAHICVSYMFYCTPSLLPEGAVKPVGFLAWIEWMYQDSEHSLVTFFLLCYNSFVFLFVSTVVVMQVWYATRNLTSNEVWFTERYRWMFKLGTRSYSMYDQGFMKNCKEFFLNGDLCLISYQVPPMNSHLTKISKRYAQQLKAKQEAAMAAAASRGGGPQAEREAMMEAGLLEDEEHGGHGHSHGGGHGHSHGGGHGHSHGGAEEHGGHGGFDQSPAYQAASQFDYVGAVSSLPTDKQDELMQVQGLLQVLIQGQELTKPAEMDAGTFERLSGQAKNMYAHYQSAMQNMQTAQSSPFGVFPAGGGAAATEEQAPANTGSGGSPTAAAPPSAGVTRRKAD